MSNMTMDFNPPTPPKPVQVFTIIRLTNHAPVRVLLDEWKALAEGRWNNGDPESPYYQEIGIRALYLREPWKIPVRTVGDGETIVHAWACLDDGEYDRRTERVHADRLLTAMETADRGTCDRHILAVADELRERIKDEGLRRSVTEAVDLSRRARDGATVAIRAALDPRYRSAAVLNGVPVRSRRDELSDLRGARADPGQSPDRRRDGRKTGYRLRLRRVCWPERAHCPSSLKFC